MAMKNISLHNKLKNTYKNNDLFSNSPLLPCCDRRMPVIPALFH
jgi:hypothetical protein